MTDITEIKIVSTRILTEIFDWKWHKSENAFILVPSEKWNLNYRIPIFKLTPCDFNEVDFKLIYNQYFKGKYTALMPLFAEDKNLFSNIIDFFKSVNLLDSFSEFLNKKYKSLIDFSQDSAYNICINVLEFWHQNKESNNESSNH